MPYLLLIVTVLFSACSVKHYEHNSSKIIIIKSPKIKFADLGYIRHSKSSVALELFVAGTPIEKIEINHLICVSAGCMSKGGFNDDYLHASYPDNLLQNIVLGSEIYDGENRVQTDDGFEQKISSKDVTITYRVSSKMIYFKDKKNRIIFKIKDTQ
ncbi:MAG: hypothetical protein U9P38_01200 [Campylobacterota bacterium]|nr:hypothetical protein [Campylobacterota bacterium]